MLHCFFQNLTMPKLKAFIVEDEPLYADQLEILLKEAGFWHIGTADNAADAYEMVSEVRPDFMLVDVNIKGSIDGIELVKRLLQIEPELLIIFVTSYQDERTFKRASKTAPIAFLPKPIDEEQILRTLELLINKISIKPSDQSISEITESFTDRSVFLKSNHALVKIKLSDIQFIEVNNRECIIYSGSNWYTIRRSLSELEEKLPQGLLTKVHRSFLVNLKYMDSYDTLRNRIIIKEHEIPVSKAYKGEVLSSLEMF